MTHNPQGEKVIIIGFPYPEKSGVVITIQNPEVSDTIKELIDGIKDPPIGIIFCILKPQNRALNQ